MGVNDSQNTDSALFVALLVIQFVLVLSVALGAGISRHWNQKQNWIPWRIGPLDRATAGIVDTWTIVVWFVLTLFAALMTQASAQGWAQLGLSPPWIDTRTATAVIFWADLLFASWFVLRSGGWSDSPYTSVLVAVPTFAILLDETGPRIFGYVLWVVWFSGICFILAQFGLAGAQSERERRRQHLANWVLSSSMLGLAAWIGVSAP